MSRVELDAADRGSVERAREALAVSSRMDFAAASRTDLLELAGDLQGSITILLRVVDGGGR